MPKQNSGQGPYAQPGIPVDVSGGPTIDPTRNVLDLVAAQVVRLNDLADERQKLADSKIQCLKDVQALQAAHQSQMAAMRTSYEAELREKETARLDAIRAVDVAAVQQAAAVAEVRASVLAAQVTSTSDAMRAQVAAAQVSAEAKLTQALEPLQAAIAQLNQSMYQLAGQRTEKSESRGGNQWIIATIISVLFGVLSIAMAIAAFVSRG